MRGLEVAPSAQAASDTPNTKWTKKRLEEHAAAHGVDIEGATTKADILAAITADPDANQAAEETPATGDTKE